MKLRFSIIAIVSVLIIVAGCATKNPAYTALTPQQQATNTTIPPYIVNPSLNQISNSIAGAATAAAPINPYAGLTDWAIKLAFGIAGAAAAGYVTAKNRGVVIDTLAAGVVKAGPTAAQAVMDHAATTPAFTAVADAINNNTGANQTSTGTTKTTG